MILSKTDFKVLVPKDQVDEKSDDDDFDWEIEVEGESEADDEIEVVEAKEDSLFGELLGSMAAEVPRGDEDAASSAATRIIAESMSYKGVGSSDDPYTPLPSAQRLDRVITYDAYNLSFGRVYQRASRSVQSTSRAVSDQMRRVLLARSLNRLQRDQQRGRLDRTKLHTLNLPGRPQPNRRVFTKRMHGQSSKVAIGILVDQSGSMSARWDFRDKIGSARAATVAMGDALHPLEALGVKFGVWGFDSHNGRVQSVSEVEMGFDRREPLRFHEYKTFNEDWRVVAPRVGAMEALENNCDGEAIRWAAQQILKVEKVDRRVLIVLSDGSPMCLSARDCRLTGDRDGGVRIHQDTKAAVKDVISAGIETLGIGICSEAVKRYYPSWVVIDSPGDLETVLLSGLRTALGVQSARHVA